MNILFLCSMGENRSKTAAVYIKATTMHRVRHAGLSKGAALRIQRKDIVWADLILVMEQEHVDQLKTFIAKTDKRPLGKKVICLNIPDEFKYLDHDLLDLIRDRFEDLPDLIGQEETEDAMEG